MFANGVDALKIQGRLGSMNFLAVFSLSLKNLCQKPMFNIKHKSRENITNTSTEVQHNFLMNLANNVESLFCISNEIFYAK